MEIKKYQRRDFLEVCVWGGRWALFCQALLLSGSWEEVQPSNPELRKEGPSESSRCVS